MEIKSTGKGFVLKTGLIQVAKAKFYGYTSNLVHPSWIGKKGLYFRSFETEGEAQEAYDKLHEIFIKEMKKKR